MKWTKKRKSHTKNWLKAILMIYYILNNWHSDAHNHNVCKLFNKFLCKCICCEFFHWIYYVLWKKENQPLLMDTINNRDIFISVHALFACFDASSNNVAECLRKRILNCEYIRELQTADADAFITNRLSAIINVVDDEFSKFIAIQCANHALKFIRYVNEYIWIRSVWQYYFNNFYYYRFELNVVFISQIQIGKLGPISNATFTSNYVIVEKCDGIDCLLYINNRWYLCCKYA